MHLKPFKSRFKCFSIFQFCLIFLIFSILSNFSNFSNFFNFVQFFPICPIFLIFWSFWKYLQIDEFFRYVEDPTRFPDLWHVDEVGLLTVEDRYPWVPQLKSKSWRFLSRQHQQQNDVARALVDQQDLCVDSLAVLEWSSSHLGPAHRHLYSSNMNNEAEDLGNVLSLNQNYSVSSSSSVPSVDFPFQFNFGSIYGSSLTIYFDNWESSFVPGVPTSFSKKRL